ncbi:DNA polymerase [Vibrio splendidus]|uniref:DNA polymerase n=1 Tax=Vibrio crassostreae TaxID=246167 RepID=UPI00352FC39F
MLDQRLKHHLAAGQLPADLLSQVRALSVNVSDATRGRITRHVQHLNHRESIRIDYGSLEKRIRKYSKTNSKRSQAIAKTLKGIEAKLTRNEAGYWHRPYVSPFHTKTGRDCALGSSLNQIPKEYWPRLLSAPKGSVYVLLDYCQQEPVIAAYLAGCKKLLEWYDKGDIYGQLAGALTQSKLTREQSKQLLVGRLYGMGFNTIAEKLGVSLDLAKEWLNKLSCLIYPIEPYLDAQARDIKKQGEAHSLGWRHAVSDSDSYLSLRNWQVQATGADIMRRACISLDEANIPLLLTNHDSFLVRLEADKFNEQLDQAIKALTVASDDVLMGFQLRVKVEMHLPYRD